MLNTSKTAKYELADNGERTLSAIIRSTEPDKHVNIDATMNFMMDKLEELEKKLCESARHLIDSPSIAVDNTANISSILRTQATNDAYSILSAKAKQII